MSEEIKKEIFKWRAPAYIYKERSKDWFIGISIFFISIILISFIYENYTLGIFLIIAFILILSFARRKPQDIDYIINEEGLIIDGDLVPFKKITNFWIDYHHPQPRLMATTYLNTNPFIDIPIPLEKDKEIKETLLKKGIREIENPREPLAHKIARYFEF